MGNKSVFKDIVTNKWLTIFIVSFSVFFLDQFTKTLALMFLLGDSATTIITNFFDLIIVYNYGVSFSMLMGLSSIIILCISISALVILLITLYKMFNFSKWHIKLSVGGIIGGAFGNIYDRASLGAVIDFLHIHYKQYSFPVFNFADVFITLSAIILFINLFKKTKKEKSCV